ncbi:hypothetical protein CSB93_3643 [Pseudomonas paraeruginosa]|jgi:hypothetical protein|uniref:Uncharacterized protein n=1 Tax=Pseudomonas paraeruginosa TaxID=2994495 RepID=A0A2R3IXR8_9PSED|nr:hypothetical protein CSB93_3643 [Pseudomonas paraeruginosa]AWE90336.1 hypothetical protein CSC28_2425 [Pseudomonas paraeruginosa]
MLNLQRRVEWLISESRFLQVQIYAGMTFPYRPHRGGGKDSGV